MRANNDALPAGWRWFRLGDHILKVGSGVTPTGGQASYSSQGTPLIRSQNVHMNRFEYEGLAFISREQDADMEGSRVLPNDVLLNITGASIGRVCVVPDELCPANVNQHISIIRLRESLVPTFFAYYFATPGVQKFISHSQAGATRQALTKAMIEHFRIPAPDREAQEGITRALREQLGLVERARAAAAMRRRAAKALPAAYLNDIFTDGTLQKLPAAPLAEVNCCRRSPSPRRVISPFGP
jgi:type I restriction enzyme S subunit